MTTISTRKAGKDDYQNRVLNPSGIPPFWPDSVAPHKSLGLSRQKTRHFGGISHLSRQVTQIRSQNPTLCPGTYNEGTLTEESRHFSQQSVVILAGTASTRRAVKG